jgi:hypothetical protein
MCTPRKLLCACSNRIVFFLESLSVVMWCVMYICKQHSTQHITQPELIHNFVSTVSFCHVCIHNSESKKWQMSLKYCSTIKHQQWCITQLYGHPIFCVRWMLYGHTIFCVRWMGNAFDNVADLKCWSNCLYCGKHKQAACTRLVCTWFTSDIRIHRSGTWECCSAICRHHFWINTTKVTWKKWNLLRQLHTSPHARFGSKIHIIRCSGWPDSRLLEQKVQLYI